MSTQFRPRLHVSVLVAGAAVVLALLFVNTQKASAIQFCWGANLAPYGQGGDRCWGPAANAMNYAAVVTQGRAGCVDIADGANNLLTSWVCGGSGSWPANAAEVYLWNYFGTWRKGVIRNNNTANWGVFGGQYNCLNSCNGP